MVTELEGLLIERKYASSPFVDIVPSHVINAVASLTALLLINCLNPADQPGSGKFSMICDRWLVITKLQQVVLEKLP